jgi:diguanylate cyclase (GGDEF)-like protein
MLGEESPSNEDRPRATGRLKRGFWDGSMQSIPVEWWMGGIGILFVAAASGFCAGYYCARLNDRRACERARTGVAQLFQTMLQTLDTARELCGLLEKIPDKFLKPEQTAQLEKRRGGLLEALTRIITRHAPPAQAEQPPPPAAHEFAIEWLMHPVDPATDLPDRAAFETNLSALLAACRTANCESSLLLVRVDKLPGLVSRFGRSSTEKLIRRLAGVVCRAVRDEDLVCRCNGETLGILFPRLNLEGATRLGRAVRDSVRNQHFRIEETGPEVLVTASFGCTSCRPDENVELILNRAFDALSKSQRVGRNQLHVHDGSALVHCAAV